MSRQMTWSQADWDAWAVKQRQHALPATPKSSKYHNVRCVVDGHTFASKKEGAYYLQLKARLAAGEIRDLELQVRLPLTTRSPEGVDVVVADYIADFCCEEYSVAEHAWSRVVVDVKGVRTHLYELKKKWLWLQSGIAIREIV
jgi:hypothetical protein